LIRPRWRLRVDLQNEIFLLVFCPNCSVFWASMRFWSLNLSDRDISISSLSLKQTILGRRAQPRTLMKIIFQQLQIWHPSVNTYCEQATSLWLSCKKSRRPGNSRNAGTFSTIYEASDNLLRLVYHMFHLQQMPRRPCHDIPNSTGAKPRTAWCFCRSTEQIFKDFELEYEHARVTSQCHP